MNGNINRKGPSLMKVRCMVEGYLKNEWKRGNERDEDGIIIIAVPNVLLYGAESWRMNT